MKKTKESKLSLEKLRISRLSNSSTVHIFGGNETKTEYTGVDPTDTKKSTGACGTRNTTGKTTKKNPQNTNKAKSL